MMHVMTCMTVPTFFVYPSSGALPTGCSQEISREKCRLALPALSRWDRHREQCPLTLASPWARPTGAGALMRERSTASSSAP